MNMMNYTDLIPYLTLITILAGAVAAAFIKPGKFKNTKTAVFISIMSSMAVVIISFDVILTTNSLEKQNMVNNAKFTKQAIDKLWLFPNQLLKDAKHARPEFISSLYYNNNTVYNLTKHNVTEPTIKSEMEEQYIALVLIQSWEDYLTLRNLDKTGDTVWIHNFLQWAQSPYLKKIYDNLKYNFSATTIEFGNLLFKYANTIPVPSNDPEIYKETTIKLLNDPKSKQIFQTKK